MVDRLKRAEGMFSLGRKLDVAKTFCVRPVSFYSTDSLTGFGQLDVTQKEKREIFVPEHLENSLKSAIDPLQVLSSLPSNSSEVKSLTNDSIIGALRTITTLQRANSQTMQPHFITKHPKFELLCRRLKLCSTTFTPNELVDSLKCLCSLGVPKNSEISLVLLQLIRHEINFLDLNQVMFLTFLLKRQKSCSNIEEAVRTALPMVFDQGIPHEVDVNTSVADLLKMLSFMASHREFMRDRNVKKICRLLADRKDEISLENAINIIHHLCAVNRFEVGNVIRLMNFCIRKLIRSNEVDVNELILLTQRLVTIAKDKMLSFQYLIHGLLNSCGERISHENLGLDLAIHLQTTCKKISYRNMTLLKYIGNEIASDPDQCRTMELSPLLTIVQSFANNAFIPKEEDKSIWLKQIMPAILENHQLASIQPTSNIWMKFTLQLMTLEYFDQKLIDRVLSSPYLDNYLNRKHLDRLDLSKVLILYQTASMHSGIDTSCVQQDVINNAFLDYVSQMNSSDAQESYIREFVKNYAIENVRTKHLHPIPTLVKVNKSTMAFKRFPNDIPRDDNGFALIDDIPCEKDEVLVCVDTLKRYSMIANVSRRNLQTLFDENRIGLFRLRRRQLKQLGVVLCEINYRRLEYLNPEKKQEYVFNSIMKAASDTEYEPYAPVNLD